MSLAAEVTRCNHTSKSSLITTSSIAEAAAASTAAAAAAAATPTTTITATTITPSRMANSILIYSAIFLLAIATLLTLNQSVECHMIKRTQYHEQGLHGPKSYKFGYTSGDEKNPQERHEVSDGHGHVKGWYSFVDASGKYQVIHYEAHPKYGFKVHNHKSKSYNNGKRHYGV